MCFTCSVCLVCWEPTDEPWWVESWSGFLEFRLLFVTRQTFSLSSSRSEHERHSPNCPFVKGEHTQNVPLSVTLATSPAQFPNSSDSSDKIACYGFGSCPQFLAAATKRGKICIWDVSKLMKVKTPCYSFVRLPHLSCLIGWAVKIHVNPFRSL